MACWYDNILQPSINDWTELSGRPDWAPLQYLHVDSTDHEAYHLDDLPVTPDTDHQASDAAIARMLPRYLDPVAGFLDVFVKRAAPPDSLPRVRWHHGHVGYQQAPSWPPPGTRQIRLYLGDGTLRSAQPADAGQVRWVHDPSDLIPSVPRDPFSALALAADESVLHARPDVVTFTTAPFTEPLDLAGPVRARLHLGADGPAGAHIGSGDPAWVEIDMTHVGYRLRPGHALRLALASSDYPNFLPHPGTDENPWLAVSGQRTTQSLGTGREQASYLTLTVVRSAAP
jgi:predicted acyl esterase